VPTVIIIAGPNGAGKTTFASEYLSVEDREFEFVNADEISRGLNLNSEVLAARIMLERIDDLENAGANFVIETTLSSLGYARKIPRWLNARYTVSLAFLRLDSVEQSIARVRKRVAAGGHDIPEETIRRRFGKSWRYFETIYRPIVDEWYVWEAKAAALPCWRHGMDDIRRGLDFQKAQAALKRAAEKALHGTREERSGRFFPKQRRPNDSPEAGRPVPAGERRSRKS
jgi:predicted ABC-type ATPase